MFVHARHEAFYTVAVCFFFFVFDFSEKIVPNPKFQFSFFKVGFCNFYFSQASFCEPLNGCIQKLLDVRFRGLRCLFCKLFTGCFACFKDNDFGA